MAASSYEMHFTLPNTSGCQLPATSAPCLIARPFGQMGPIATKRRAPGSPKRLLTRRLDMRQCPHELPFIPLREDSFMLSKILVGVLGVAVLSVGTYVYWQSINNNPDNPTDQPGATGSCTSDSV